ncbi:MAG: thermonuclease family protein [Lentimicrobiaceae bacterium]|nr:thermonuclease family protein [Lentimicrobiaceae bacterium]
MKTYKVIKGTFHVKGYSPDGDSIRFLADKPENWDWSGFDWEKKPPKEKQLRIEAIDALETHYEGVRQPHSFAIAALEHLLAQIGISNVQYNLMVSKIISADDEKPGYIVTAGVDKFNRPISYVFNDKVKLNDGQLIDSDKIPVEKSVNYILAKEGLVYPTFYQGMDEKLMEKFRKVIAVARKESKGLWAIEKTSAFKVWNIYTLQDDVIIMPKLFRRFVSFFEAASEMSEFMSYIAKNPDKVIVNGTKAHLHDFITADGTTFGLTVLPEDIIFT